VGASAVLVTVFSTTWRVVVLWVERLAEQPGDLRRRWGVEGKEAEHLGQGADERGRWLALGDEFPEEGQSGDRGDLPLGTQRDRTCYGLEDVPTPCTWASTCAYGCVSDFCSCSSRRG